MNLDDIRNEIDSIDTEIITLFIKRMELCGKVAQTKLDNNLPVFQKGREKDVIKKARDNAPDSLKCGAELLISDIMDISKILQQRIIDANSVVSDKEYKRYTIYLAYPQDESDIRRIFGKIAAAGSDILSAETTESGIILKISCCDTAENTMSLINLLKNEYSECKILSRES